MMSALHAIDSLTSTARRLEKHYKRLLLPHMPIQFDDSHSAHRPEIEAYIAEQFYINYQAKITHFSPYLLSSQSDNDIKAVMGFQSAQVDAPLFLEQYFNERIETVLSQSLDKDIQRHQIAEVANLTSNHRGSSHILFILTIAILHAAGFKWAVFTANRQVQALLAKLNLVTQEVGDARLALLVDSSESWGTYYDDNPKVVVGDLTQAIETLKDHKVISFVLKNHQRIIDDSVEKIAIV